MPDGLLVGSGHTFPEGKMQPNKCPTASQYEPQPIANGPRASYHDLLVGSPT